MRICRPFRNWTAISTDGPQILPASSGGVTAFKFRDPEGHPLELLAFAPGATPAHWAFRSANLCLGIDHSAVSVADTDRSVAFYSRLGLARTASSLNVGPEQEKLDDLLGAVVEVTALAPPIQAVPHVELLCYRGNFDRRNLPTNRNDVAATQLVFEVESDGLDAIVALNRDTTISSSTTAESGGLRVLLRDPDGHLLCLEAALQSSQPTNKQKCAITLLNNTVPVTSAAGQPIPRSTRRARRVISRVSTGETLPRHPSY